MYFLKKAIALLILLALCLSLFSACTTKPAETHSISIISSDNPQIGFWIALNSNGNSAKATFPFVATISFGTAARNITRFVVTISSDDFEISKSCPDEYVIDGTKYSEDDFYLAPSKRVSHADLPQSFTISLTPKKDLENCSGSLDIAIAEYLIGGSSNKTLTLYYYGDSNMICFSSISQENAASIFNNK